MNGIRRILRRKSVLCFAPVLIICVAALCIGLLLVCKFGSEKIRGEYPMFIKTIDRPDSGVGEVIHSNLRIEGRWSVDNSDDANATFVGTLGSIDVDDYGGIYDDPERDVTIAFAWDFGHWIGSIPYISTDGENKTLIVYTDKDHSVWLFESVDRVSIAPADHIDDVLQICQTLGVDLK